MRAVELIAAKRDGAELTDAQVSWFIDAYVRGEVAHEQMSAMLMAVCWRGMTPRECAAWTQAYVSSGTRLSFDIQDGAGVTRPIVDKHSTGGVGDKITLVLTPLIMTMGGAVPQLSGRGLGHTGGTLDKLESISGFRSVLSVPEMHAQLSGVGGFIAAASEELAPADRLIYALRDVTATVESVPLIAASIMSKKIAEGTDGLVLDVKVGHGAFMKTRAAAEELGRAMIELGAVAGVQTRVVMSAMDSPLGRSAGNAVEVLEALEVLQGGGPRDVHDLTIALASEMLEVAGLDAEGVGEALRDGRAMDAFVKLVEAQGGDVLRIRDGARVVEQVCATQSGFVTGMDAMRVGVAAWRLGAGRARREDAVDFGAGVLWRHGVGEYVRAGEVLFELRTNDESLVEGAVRELDGAVVVSDTAVEPGPLVLDVLR
jgi:thymidine phosphorylase